MEHPFQAPGVEMITQEYLAARLELRSRTDLTSGQHERLENELVDEHGLRCAQEWKSVLAQVRADQEVGCQSLSEPAPAGSRRAHKPLASPIIRRTMAMNEPGRVGVHNEEAWELYLEAEERELEMGKDGHLAKLLGDPLPDESPEELERLAQDDRLRALEGLVDLKSENGEIIYKPLADLDPRPQVEDQGRGGADRLDRRATKVAPTSFAIKRAADLLARTSKGELPRPIPENASSTALGEQRIT